jgi:hypothetical protein
MQTVSEFEKKNEAHASGERMGFLLALIRMTVCIAATESAAQKTNPDRTCRD